MFSISHFYALALISSSYYVVHRIEIAHKDEIREGEISMAIEVK